MMARRPVRNCKCHTLSLLAACLAVTAVVSVISVVMSPARIDFSITQATHNKSSDGWLELRITLEANNTSSRTSVFYGSIYIDVRNSMHSSENNSAGACIGTDVVTPLPLHQKPNSTERIHAALELERAYSAWASLGVVPRLEDFIGDRSSRHDFSVKVTALARFKRQGIPWTRLYNISLYCQPVKFFSKANHSRDIWDLFTIEPTCQ